MKRALSIICFVVLAWIPCAAFGATVAPALIEVSASRGETIESFFQVINASTTEQKYYLGVMKFEPTEGTGAPSFISYEKDRSGLPEWIDFQVNEFPVPANSKVDVPFTIAIPDDISSGGYYSALTVSNAPHDIVATNGAIVDAKTAVLVLLTVEGETNESAVLLDLVSDVEGKAVSSIKGEFVYRIQNQGNVHVRPEGVLRFKDVFGRQIYSQAVNEKQGRVLPSSTRTYKEEVDLGENSFLGALNFQMRTLLVGPVTAELDLKYGQQGQLFAKTSFWFVPWQLMISILILVIVVVSLYKKSARRSRT